MTHIPIFVINLDHSFDRLAVMGARFSAIGMTFERVPAILGKSLCKNERERLYPPMRRERELGDSEIGCFASHLKALRLVFERKLPRAIILEDDADFHADFIPWASPELPLPKNTDILKLERMHTRSTKAIVISNYAGRSICFSAKPSFGCACYLVTHRGAEKILQRCSVIESACDHQFFQYWKNGIITYEVIPAPVWQDQSPSTLQSDRMPLDLMRRKNKQMLTYKLKNWLPKNFTRLVRYLFQIRYFGFRTFNRRDIV